jgi:hypothetical protein
MTGAQQAFKAGVREGVRQERERIFKSNLWNILREQGWSEFSMSQLCAELELLKEVEENEDADILTTSNE